MYPEASTSGMAWNSSDSGNRYGTVRVTGTSYLKQNCTPGCKVSFMARSPAFFLEYSPCLCYKIN